MHSREWQAWVSVCSLSSHNFWISAVQYFQTHPSTSFVFYIFYVAYFIATPTLGLLNTITLQWLLLGEVAAWTATEFPYCWCRSVSSPRSVACWMDASGSILLPHLHPSRQLHLLEPQREPTYAVTEIETLGICHKSTTISKNFVRKYAVGTWSCCTNLHLTCCLIKPLSLCDWLVPAIKGRFIVKCLTYTNVGLLFLYFHRQSLRRGFEHQLQRDAQLPG